MFRSSLAAAFLAALAAVPGAWAQPSAWPARPVKWIVPYTPGGITDSVTRLVARDRVAEALGQVLPQPSAHLVAECQLFGGVVEVHGRGAAVRERSSLNQCAVVS